MIVLDKSSSSCRSEVRDGMYEGLNHFPRVKLSIVFITQPMTNFLKTNTNTKREAQLSTLARAFFPWEKKETKNETQTKTTRLLCIFGLFEYFLLGCYKKKCFKIRFFPRGSGGKMWFFFSKCTFFVTQTQRHRPRMSRIHPKRTILHPFYQRGRSHHR